MKQKRAPGLTFAILDKRAGFPEPPKPEGEEFPLPAWYRSIYNTPLEQLSLEDICKACRQQIHLDHVIPIALDFLQTDALAGEMYDGELLVSLKSVPHSYWPKHPDEATELNSICEKVRNEPAVENYLLQDIEEILKKTHQSDH